MRTISLILAVIMIMNGLPAFAAEPVRHLYLDNSVRTVVLLADQKELKKEAAEFRDFRFQYATFWTVIICALAAYAYFRKR